MSHTIFVTPLCHIPSFTHHLSHHFVAHHLSHTIFDTPSFTHHLARTIFDTPSLTHHLSHTTLSPTIFHIPSFTSSSTHHLSHTTVSHTIFHTQHCHTLSFTHHLSHTSFTQLSHTPSFTHHLSPLCHTPSFTHNLATASLSHRAFTHYPSHPTLSQTIFPPPLLCLSFLPRPRYTISAHFWKKLSCGVIRSFNLCWVRQLVDDPAVAAGYFRLYVMRLLHHQCLVLKTVILDKITRH